MISNIRNTCHLDRRTASFVWLPPLNYVGIRITRALNTLAAWHGWNAPHLARNPWLVMEMLPVSEIDQR